MKTIGWLFSNSQNKRRADHDSNEDDWTTFFSNSQNKVALACDGAVAGTALFQTLKCRIPLNAIYRPPLFISASNEVRSRVPQFRSIFDPHATRIATILKLLAIYLHYIIGKYHQKREIKRWNTSYKRPVGSRVLRNRSSTPPLPTLQMWQIEKKRTNGLK